METYQFNRKIACINDFPFTGGYVDEVKLGQSIKLIKEVLMDIAVDLNNLEAAIEQPRKVLDQAASDYECP